MEFETKDSGKRVTYASGMNRDVQDDKPRFDLVFRGPLLRRWAELLKRGADKYGADNWTKANSQEELDRFIASAARHFAQWMAGDRDEDHAAAVVFNLNAAEYVWGRIDRRYPIGMVESDADEGELFDDSFQERIDRAQALKAQVEGYNPAFPTLSKVPPPVPSPDLFPTPAEAEADGLRRAYGSPNEQAGIPERYA